MRPKKLTLCAWGPYRDKQEIDFSAYTGKGIFLITGATGAGKTTIFDAITYALYGALSGDERDKERNSVRSDFADAQTPTFVELIMEHGGKEYRIVRNPEYLRPKKRARGGESLTKEKDNAVLYYPDGSILEGTKEVNAALQELLVLDYQQFKKISMIAQGEFARLLVASPKDKTRIFREIFGTGIYEKFTAGLGVRSRHLYGKVMEQKAKLEEDIRLLTVDLDKSVWNQETRQRLQTVTETEYWNYEVIAGLLEEMVTESKQMVQKQKAAYLEAEKAVEKLTAKITREEELLQKQRQLEKVQEEKEQLKTLAPEIKMLEKTVTAAINAGFVEGAEQLVRQINRQQEIHKASAVQVGEELRLLLQEAKELKPLVEKAEVLRKLLETAEKCQELEKNKQSLKQELEKSLSKLKERQEDYLEQEAVCRICKAKYEDADHRRKLSAIGLAASLLEEGKPCPVCGSLTHPAPAGIEDDIISEEAMKKLKKEAEKADEELRRLYEQTVVIKTVGEEQQKRLAGMEQECQMLQKQLAAVKDKLCKEYLAMPLEQSTKLLQTRLERAATVSELIIEKERQQKQLTGQIGATEEQLQDATKVYKETLLQYGFVKEKSYQEAKLEKTQREQLQRRVEDYRKNVAANQELYQHLKNALKSYKPVDVEALKITLAEHRDQKDAALKLQRDWERAYGDVRKTGSLMRDKLAGIEEASEVYGYVKDLENMASGNNPRRLVFEQYVLASYFEEILKAANLRFQKMTAGRYEMSRVGQVGDGRVKDNLEIQVLDYYTGKYRSVRTLSGGESFKASLSLALGMSDVIQAMNGGIRVDTLFVDEGFGALDEESLDQACNTLMGLVEKDCLIGIISHVPELRERISQQLLIEKTSSGSFIRSSVK